MRILIITLAFSFALISPGLAASPFDGVYRGSYTWAGNGNMRCTAGTELTIRVADGKFRFGTPDSNDRVVVEIGADGSFAAQSGQRNLQGKIKDGQMSATTSSSRCNYIWSLSK